MRKLTLIAFICLFALPGIAQMHSKAIKKDELKQLFMHPPESVKPWVFWYWMRSSVTKAGITADLEAMSKEGIGGVYLMSIRETANPPFIVPPIVPLTPEWWDMIHFTMAEASRLGMKIAMSPCDGWALAGGPWITPELSMQKIVWTKTEVNAGMFDGTLPQPESYEGYYKDIAVYAYPASAGTYSAKQSVAPKVTTSLKGPDVQFLAVPGTKEKFVTKDTCWIQLTYEQPFTCRSLVIHTLNSNFQAQRLIIEVSDDGRHFRYVTRLEPPRHGWQEDNRDVTHTIVPTTAKYFRFIYNPAGTEPGAEDIDFAKWKPELKITGIELSSEAKINQYEGKTGSVWRISKRTTTQQLPDNLCVPKDKLLDITANLQPNGHLKWNAPAGKWIILRIGHTSTGSKNAAAGSAGGLECDKFNPEAAKLLFEKWYGEALRQNKIATNEQVLKVFHVDSWECGSQNWSPVFAGEFKKRRGYDLLPYLPVMAGVPVQSAETSEKVLSDVRQTIAELLVDNFYGTMAKLAHAKGCKFSAESVAPTMTCDGMLHFSQVDIPMGEFWFRSPTHDKPNDMLDAISGGHIYGKNIIQAEAFTEVRLMWDEYPAMLKTMTDRNFALGINRFVLHVNVHNPWTDRKPGMTLDGVGLFFQHNQTWYKPGKAWIDYIQRCQILLQQGRPTADIAVFTGEEIPRRAVLPDRLVSTLPGIFGAERVQSEKVRLANVGIPMRTISGVTSVVNYADPENWVDPLRGYAYDSMNKDALLRLATVKNGRIVLPGGASYAMLIIPAPTAMTPNAGYMSPEVARRLQELVNDGATILIDNKPMRANGMASDATVKQSGDALWAMVNQKNNKGRVLFGPYRESTFDQLGLTRDVILTDVAGKYAKDIAWTHRTGDDFDIYFIANQQNQQRIINLSLRSVNGQPELFDALTGETRKVVQFSQQNGRTVLRVQLAANGSVFVLLRKSDKKAQVSNGKNWAMSTPVKTLAPKWIVSFNPAFGGPSAPVSFDKLYDWSTSKQDNIRYYSGTATYKQTFNWNGSVNQIWLDLGKVNNIAQVYVNGVDCGVAWTCPFRVNISKALKPGANQIAIEVTNTWANRLMGDHSKPEKEQVTWTNMPYRLEGKPLMPAGLLGPVSLVKLKY